MSIEDRDLLEEFPEWRKNPNSLEFSQGFERMAALLRAILHWKGLPVQEAEDEAMEIAIRVAVTHQDGYTRRQGSTFRSFLFRVAINRANDWWRQHQREPEELINDAAGSKEDHEERPLTDRERLLRESLSTLSSDDQRILEIRVVYGLQYEEIGEVLGITAGSARVRFQRAKERLREVLLVKK
jgi:RNA polymerase sigma factor (sigma-70 family)